MHGIETHVTNVLDVVVLVRTDVFRNQVLTTDANVFRCAEFALELAKPVLEILARSFPFASPPSTCDVINMLRNETEKYECPVALCVCTSPQSQADMENQRVT